MRSLQGRLLVLMLSLLGLVWASTAVFTWWDTQRELDELLDGHLTQAAALLVVQQSEELEEDHGGLDAPQLHRYAPRVAFQVWHEQHLMLRSSNAPATPLLPGVPTGRSGFETIRIDGEPWRVFAAMGAEQDVQVYVGEQVAARAEILHALLRGTLTPLALALPLLGLAVWWAVRQGLLPLMRLSHDLSAREPLALEPVQLPHAPTEMQPLVAALNGLLSRIGTLVETERRFTADAAHELRTPIAAIRAQAQVAMGEHRTAARQHALQATLQGCDRATRLVEQLLMLARLEVRGSEQPQLVDLGALVRRVAAECATEAVARQQQLSLQVEGPCRVQGNELLLAVLVRNLVDNAVRYSPPGAAIQMQLTEAPAGTRLQIDDSGPGMPAEALARLGERFFRELGTDVSGSGLGWSIVRRIAATQGLQVAVAPSVALGGLGVTVTWPRALPQ